VSIPWPPRRDLAIAAGALVLGVVLHRTLPEVRIPVRPPAGEPAWLDLVPILIAAAAQTLRRTRPVAALVGGVAAIAAGPVLVGSVGLVVLIIVTDLLYCAVLYTAQRTSWLVVAAAGLTLLVAAGGGLAGGGLRTGLLTLVNVGFLLGVPVAWGLEVRWHRTRAEHAHRLAEQARELVTLQTAAAVAEERARMARDLHDVIAGQLSAIAIQSAAALNLPDPDRDTLLRVLGAVRRDSVASLAEMRAMIGLLRVDGATGDDPRTAPAGLDRLDEVLDRARAAGTPVTLDDRRSPEHSGAEPVAAVDLVALRVVQESLTNAMKHAPGRPARVVLGHADGTLVVEVHNDLPDPDDGAGSTARGDGTGSGLLGLAERARAVGGRFVAGPQGRRWTARAELPSADRPVPAGSDDPSALARADDDRRMVGR
jgi:signal transduction histidine kinase